MKLQGKVFKYGDHIDTDVIIPAQYLTTADPVELAKNCMSDIDKDFAKEVQQGDIIVGGINFCCGSSREHAPLAIKGSGVSCVIAKTFARIFFRNSINIGLPILECPEAVEDAEKGDVIEVDTAKGVIVNKTKNKEYSTAPFPEFLQNIINSGGLINSIKEG